MCEGDYSIGKMEDGQWTIDRGLWSTVHRLLANLRGFFSFQFVQFAAKVFTVYRPQSTVNLPRINPNKYLDKLEQTF